MLVLIWPSWVITQGPTLFRLLIPRRGRTGRGCGGSAQFPPYSEEKYRPALRDAPNDPEANNPEASNPEVSQVHEILASHRVRIKQLEVDQVRIKRQLDEVDDRDKVNNSGLMRHSPGFCCWFCLYPETQFHNLSTGREFVEVCNGSVPSVYGTTSFEDNSMPQDDEDKGNLLFSMDLSDIHSTIPLALDGELASEG